jgi:hypothetical protein
LAAAHADGARGDCGGAGDCFFHCVSESLNSEREIYDKYDSKIIREKISKTINSNNFPTIIEHYRILHEIGEFEDEWNPQEIKNIKDLQKEICKEGNNFLADHIIFQLFQELFNLNIIIFNNTNYLFLFPIIDNSLFK